MKPLPNAFNWPRGYGWLVLVVIVVVASAPACTTPTEKEDTQKKEQVIGQPPPAEEDPFFVRKMPGEAVPAAPSGSIGDDEEEKADDSKDSQEPEGPEAPARAETEQDGPEKQPEPADSAEPPASEQPQCFSCVRICPAEGDCDSAQEDVICGWGVHTDSAEAKRRAKAECDATLDMARQMPVWSEIAGECPAATCR